VLKRQRMLEQISAARERANQVNGNAPLNFVSQPRCSLQVVQLGRELQLQTSEDWAERAQAGWKVERLCGRHHERGSVNFAPVRSK
jgi:hypothetical protein